MAYGDNGTMAHVGRMGFGCDYVAYNDCMAGGDRTPRGRSGVARARPDAGRATPTARRRAMALVAIFCSASKRASMVGRAAAEGMESCFVVVVFLRQPHGAEPRLASAHFGRQTPMHRMGGVVQGGGLRGGGEEIGA